VTLTMRLPQPVLALWTHRTLLIALGASFIVHLLVTVGTPAWFRVWVPREPVPLSAVLLPPPALEASAPVASTTPRPKAKAVRPRAPRPLPTPKSEATFVAPENSIAVEPIAAAEEMGPFVPRGTDGSAAVGDASADAAAAVVPPQAAPVAAEKTAPTEVVAAKTEAAPAVELPSRVSISYNATTSIADGVAHYSWKRDGQMYTFESTFQATGFFVSIFAGTITQQSMGAITPAGLEPQSFSIRRGDKEPDTAEFQYATRQVKLSRGGDSKQVPMPPGLQDTQSFLFQLAYEAPKLKTPEDRLNILVTNARGVNRYTFKKMGETALETRLGPLETVHLVRETSEPRDSYEVWLSPKHHYLPVKLKFFVDRFPAELIATNITSKP
jgi:hypothetical protein